MTSGTGRRRTRWGTAIGIGRLLARPGVRGRPGAAPPAERAGHEPGRERISHRPRRRSAPNALRRRSDRLRDLSRRALLTTLPLLCLAGAVIANDLSGRHYRAAATQQTADRNKLSATVTENVPHHPEPGSDESRDTRYEAGVRFTDVHGANRTARAQVPPGLSAGSTVEIWTDGAGRVTEPPMTAEEIRTRSAAWAVLAVPAAATVGYAARRAVVAALLRRNLADWEAKWAETAPWWGATR